ncbi:HAD family hydrolase [Paenibacillus sp. N4]|uniref:HAD family hydrolase n=1 Tax=Paenibacillus vietnamensis TaxID=2590547 RepID=UPI001CD05539|nr:HAD family hydrolase [Paenibacillus vietnamensis]MCA0753796.1 HAD family hydrolase [Paenibacillus vietnamensis]
MFKAVFFDLDDTLYDQLSPFELALGKAGLNDCVRSREGASDLFKSIRRHSDRLWIKHAGGELTLERLRIERTCAAFAELGIDLPEEAASLLQHCYEREQANIKLHTGAKDLLMNLKEGGMETGIITNGPVSHQTNKITALGLKDAISDRRIFISDAIGAAKPDVGVFHYVRQAAGYQPHELIYVGDAWHNDIAPAYRAGWLAVWVNVRGQLPHAKDEEVRYSECASLEEAAGLLLDLCKPQP